MAADREEEEGAEGEGGEDVADGGEHRPVGLDGGGGLARRDQRIEYLELQVESFDYAAWFYAQPQAAMSGYFDLIGKPNKKLIVSRENAYHGSTIAAASLGGMSSMHKQFTALPYIHHAQQPYWFELGGERSPDDFGRALDEVRSELDGLDQRGRARFCKGLAHRMSAAEQAVQTRILVAAGLAASVDRDGRAAQRAAYEQLVEAAGADRDAIDLEVRVRTQLE